MGIFGGILERKSDPVVRSLNDSAALLKELLGGKQTRSGIRVTWKTAIEVTAVSACCRVITDGCAQVPWKLMRSDGGRTEAVDHPLADLLRTRPNGWQTSFEFVETIVLHALLTGNSFVFVNRNARGEILELIPLVPGSVEVKRESDMSLRYWVTSDKGERREVPASMIWHLRGPSWNSWKGMDPVHLAREAIGLSISTEETQAEQHKDGLRYPGLYSVDGTLTPEQHTMVRGWLKVTADAGEPLILDRGAKWHQIAMSGVDAQHLETRKHQVEEICRAFRVMPIMIGQADKTATYASAEQMFLSHVVHTLMPWYRRIEQSADANLLSSAERRGGYYTKFFPNALMRGAAKDRGEFYAKALGAGGQKPWMTADEVRDLEDMDPYGGHAAELGEGAMNVPAEGGSQAE